MIEQPEFDLFNLAPVSAEASHSEVAVSGESTGLSGGRNGSNAKTAGSTPKPWNEVPQELFLSWSDAMQRSYMRARDLAGAATAHERGEDPEFYLQRAETYR